MTITAVWRPALSMHHRCGQQQQLQQPSLPSPLLGLCGHRSIDWARPSSGAMLLLSWNRMPIARFECLSTACQRGLGRGLSLQMPWPPATALLAPAAGAVPQIRNGLGLGSGQGVATQRLNTEHMYNEGCLSSVRKPTCGCLVQVAEGVHAPLRESPWNSRKKPGRYMSIIDIAGGQDYDQGDAGGTMTPLHTGACVWGPDKPAAPDSALPCGTACL